MTSAIEMTTTQAAKGEEATFTVAAEIIPLDRIHTGANVRSGKLPTIEGLAESIRRHGVLTAITVDRRDDGDFELVAGFRRVAAARLAGLPTIPAVIRDGTDEAERLRRQLTENVAREGLRDLDQAAAMQQLLNLGVDAEAVAETVHTTPENVRAWADLLNLPRKVRRLIERGRMTAADAHPLVSLLDDKEAMRAALERVDAGWDVERAVRHTIREREREQALAAARAKLDAEGCRIIDAPRFDQFVSTSKTRKLGTRPGDVHVPFRKHAAMPCHAAFIGYDGGVVYVCTDRNRHAGVDGSGVPDLKAERAAKRAAKKAVREAHATRFATVRDAVRNRAISREEAIAHVMRLTIHDADHADHETAVALLDLPAPDGNRVYWERDALLSHAASSQEALVDVALALMVARGERALTTDRFNWARSTVAEYANLIRTSGVHQFTAAEEEVIAERGPTRWDGWTAAGTDGGDGMADGDVDATLVDDGDLDGTEFDDDALAGPPDDAPEVA